MNKIELVVEHYNAKATPFMSRTLRYDGFDEARKRGFGPPLGETGQGAVRHRPAARPYRWRA